ncbi:MAG: hypothetical protein DLM64_16180 [Solirubrobacterales bacterium]|nr:MAG: hypothetical protein DLM64_16180 [Solirubrobacterales bacterium]
MAWSDNGSEMTAIDTRQFMALMAIAQHHGRSGTPTDQAHIESFFHLKGDWPHLTGITDPAVLDAELAGSAPSTTRSGFTRRSGTSPPMTSITDAAPRSAAPAPPGCAAQGPSGSSRIEPARHDHAPRHRSRPAEPGTEAASELAPRTHQPAPPQHSALG